MTELEELRQYKEDTAHMVRLNIKLQKENDELLSSLKFINEKCEQVADGKIHADVAVFSIYASASRALGEIEK